MNLFTELRRRNVFKVGIAYLLTGWVLLQAGDFAFDLIGAPNWLIQALFVFVLLGLPIALFFAWAFELTPEGIKRESEVDRSQSIAPQTSKKLNTAIVVLMALAIAWLLYDKFSGGLPDPASTPAAEVADAADASEAGPAPESTRTSIAVLPFVNMSGDAENEYFSDGISEELLNVLVRVSSLEVASRTSSFAFKGKDVPVSTIASELGVNHVLEGSVRKAGNRVRVTAQLIDANTDRHLWSEAYERELDDIFAIQEEISNSIVAALKLTLNVDEAAAMERLQRPTDNTEAYEYYLQGRFQWRQRGEENLYRAAESLQEAVELDPQFAKAHEALAAVWTVLPSWSDFDWDESVRLALASAQAALALDPNLGEAHTILAHVKQHERDLVGSLREYRRARELEPRNATVAQWFAEFLLDTGYVRDALDMAQIAYRLDPAAPVINSVLTWAASTAGEDALAIRHMNKAIALGIEAPRAAINAIDSLQRLGELDLIRETMIDDPTAADAPLLRACAETIAVPGSATSLQALLDTQPGASERFVAWCAATFDGDPAVALYVIKEELITQTLLLRQVWRDTRVARAFRQLPEFGEFLRSLNLLPLYEAEGWPDACHALDDGGFACE